MQLLYNIGIRLYGLGIRIASLFNKKAEKWIAGRKNLYSQIQKPSDSQKVIWMHCASLGEFDQGLPVLSELKLKFPDHFILVTFFSPSGMDHYQKREHVADHVCYLPLDTPRKAKQFIEFWKPSMVIFVKYEFWTNHILQAKKIGAQLFVISGLFRKDHRFFRWYGELFRNTLRQFDWIFVQNESSKKLLNSIGINAVSVAGDNRFDRVIENKSKASSIPILDSFCYGQRTFIIGSSWPQDEEILLPYINETLHKVIIAPHNVDEKHVKGISNKLSVPYVTINNCTEQQAAEARVMIINTIGQLSNAYSYGSMAYVGGGFSGSLHNILEPAVFGLPVIFGPKYARFPEAEQFIEAGFGFSVSDQHDLRKVITEIESDLQSISAKAEAFVVSNTGASKKIIEKITSS